MEMKVEWESGLVFIKFSMWEVGEREFGFKVFWGYKYFVVISF